MTACAILALDCVFLAHTVCHADTRTGCPNMLIWDLSFYEVYGWLRNLDWPAALVLNHGSNELHTVVYCRSYLLQFLGWMGVLGCTSFGGVIGCVLPFWCCCFPCSWPGRCCYLLRFLGCLLACLDSVLV